MGQKVLFVHAHPDDETISTGATIATLVDGGSHVTVLTLTRGERGEVLPDDLQYLVGAPEDLGATRESELESALAALGVADHRILGNADARWAGRPARRYIDSGMSWGKRGAEASGILDPDSLTAADLGEVAADIAAVMIAVEPDVVVSYDADGGYGHPDHVRAHEATRTAAEVIGVPFYVLAERGPATVVVDPALVIDRKRLALGAHRTQVAVEGETFRLSSGPSRPIGSVERYRRLAPPTGAFSEQSLATRIASVVLAVILGAFVGATLTVAHQASIDVLGLRVPWGVIAALVITGTLLAGLRVVFQTRIVAAAAALGLLAAGAVLSVQSAGGSVLVPDNTVGYVFIVAPVLIAAVVLAWPPVGRRHRDTMEVPAAKGSDLK